ncbi:response regulator [Spirosoma sp. KCTC 42546]|uniref:hybrid sensor histidine kinase/response regulator n=1 Tax=Spirosoma sp. KCTC 42546 TaxID=2520506 RepID=UPI001158D88C|nr:response regulator [Spirosoma sp. KCTC 42546]QDK81605.1 response regulator [Spirosoma sp. KCTC 42546]
MATKILIIEDETLIRENVAELVRLNGYHVVTASTGREGLIQAMLHRPDLILCDIRMPEMDGYQVLEAVRDYRSLKTVPFIFLTAKAEESDIRRGMVLGADDYLTKPFTLSGLLTAIAGRLQREALRETDLQGRLAELRRSINSLSSHEYNTPLSCIIGFTTLLLDSYDEFSREDSLEMLTMIKASSLRLKRSIDNPRLLEELQQIDRVPSSYTTGSTMFDKELVNKAIGRINDRQELDVTCHLDLESAQISLSETSLGVILEELLDNAFKFSDGSHPVKLSGRRGEINYQLTISNHGRVFKPEDIIRIAPYRQFDRDIYEQQGLGLGLAIVQKLLTLTKGSMVIESQPTGETSILVIFRRELL